VGLLIQPRKKGAVLTMEISIIPLLITLLIHILYCSYVDALCSS
jgi:hypothetical protein